jgi:hypothetical protein
MNLNHLKEMSEAERRDFLANHASKVTEGTYTKPLTEEEISTYKTVLAEQSINQAILIDEFDKEKEKHKAKLKPVKQEIAMALSAIKFKAVDMNGKIYTLQDFENKLIHEVDEFGNVLLSRQPKPEERQYFLTPSLSKTA